MQQVLQIATNGSMSSGVITSQSRSMLDTMTKGKCCTLQGDFAAPSLIWLGQTATALAGDKMQIMDMAFSGDQAKQAQADVVKAYDTNEHLVQRMSELFSNWNSHFDADRDQRLKDAGDAVTAAEPVYAQMHTNLSQSIDVQVKAQDSQAAQRQQLADNLSGWRLKTYLAGGGTALGVALFGALGVTMIRQSRANRPAKRSRARAKPSPAHPARTLPQNATVRKYGRRR